MAAVSAVTSSQYIISDDDENSISSGSTVYVNQTTNSAYYENVQPFAGSRSYVNVRPKTTVANTVAIKYENIEPTSTNARTSRLLISTNPTTTTSTSSNSSDVESHTAVRPSPMTPSRRQRFQFNTGEIPELTPLHLINVFLNGITHGQVNTLAILLGVPVIDEPTNHPSTYAMETVIKWMQLYPMSLQEHHDVLMDRFRLLELNSLIPRLQGKERYTAIDPQILVEFLAAETKYFSMEQAYEFGRLLNINHIKMETLVNRNRLQRGADLIIHIFNSLDRECTHLAEPIVDRVVTALLKASERQSQYIPQDTITADTNTNRGQQTIETDGENTEEPLNQIKWKRINDILNKYKYVWIGIFIILIIAMIITIICLIYLPQLPAVIPKQNIVESDTIIYTVPNSYWLNSIDIELQGPLKPEECFANVISVLCHDIKFENTSNVVTYTNNYDYLYIERDGVISFSLNRKLSEPYLAWLFTDYKQAEQSAAAHFQHFACATPPENVWCINLNTTRNYTLPVSNYYFIRCDRGPSCALINDIQITSRNYDFNLTENYEIDSVKLYPFNTNVNIRLKQSTFYTTQHEVCLLMRLDEDQCSDSNIYDYQIAITKQYKRYDLLLYPSLILTLIIIIFIALCVTKAILVKIYIKH